MTRPIDADALRELFAETISAIANRPEMDGNLEYMIRSSAMAIKMIDDQMTVDAVPVKHGHWIDMGDFEQCSACKGTRLKEFNSFYGKVTWIRTAYCSHCGARMDEVTE